MRRDIGSAGFPNYRILEHARHTATAGTFFMVFDGWEHEYTRGACEWLLRAQQDDGSWCDSAPPSDPVTVAFVIDFLEQCYCTLLNATPPEAEMIVRINNATERGLDYVFNRSTSRTVDGLWLYKYADAPSKAKRQEQVYRYTTEVLSSVEASCRRLDLFNQNTDSVLTRLFKIAKSYRGVPAGTTSNIPDIDPTARLAELAHRRGHSTESTGLVEGIPTLFDSPEVVIGSGAPGWATMLKNSREFCPCNCEKFLQRVRELDEVAENIRCAQPHEAKLPKVLNPFATDIRRLLLRRLALDKAAAEF